MAASPRTLPPLLDLAGHPLRWRHPARARPRRPARPRAHGLLDERQSLVSYHLGRLRSDGLVTTRRSSFDGRDTYYRADLARWQELFSQTAAALHPALRAGAPPAPQPATAHARVLFLCTGNSGRSQIAEALLRDIAPDRDRGVQRRQPPQARAPGRDPGDARARDRHRRRRRASTCRCSRAERFDHVISLCDRVREVCPEFPGGPRTVHWSVPDPARRARRPRRVRAGGRRADRADRVLPARPRPAPDDPGEQLMDEQLASVRYIVTDVEAPIAFYTTHLGFTVRMTRAARLRRRRPRPAAAAAQRRRQLGRPHAARRAHARAGRLEPHPPRRRGPGRRGRAPARRRPHVPQRDRHRPGRLADRARRSVGQSRRALPTGRLSAAASTQRPGLRTIVLEWGRIGCIGFGGPPAHIALLRELCVRRRRLAAGRGLRARDRRDSACCPARPPRSSRSTAPGGCAGRRARCSAARASSCPAVLIMLPLSALFLGRRRRPGCAAPARARARPSPPSPCTRGWSSRPELAPHARARRGRVVAYGAAGARRRGDRRTVAGPGPARLRRASSSLARRGLAARAWRRPPGRCAAAMADRRAARARLDRVQGRRALLRRRLRDRPADAGRRRRHLPLDDRRRVPQRRGARTDHPRAGRAHHRRGRLCRARCRRRACSRPRVAFAPSFAFVLLGADRFERLIARPRRRSVPRRRGTRRGRRDPRLRHPARRGARRAVAARRPGRGGRPPAAAAPRRRPHAAARGRDGRRRRARRRASAHLSAEPPGSLPGESITPCRGQGIRSKSGADAQR